MFSLWVDQAVPFMSFTVWVYLTHLFFVISVVYFFNDDIIFSRFFYALNIGSLLSIVIFFFYPTTIERKAHIFNFANEMVFWFVYTLDNPVNCFPSLHVFWVMIGLIPLFYKKPNGFIWIFAWGMLIIFSTMTTKQHYFVDVLGGTLLAFLSWRFTKLLF
ncbi:MAG: phosphatase PAP2 family protein [Deltaproteobacteria bacterium]|nr:phosphatase PAP2 family protein [Deltaproteobacteria bacterium]